MGILLDTNTPSHKKVEEKEKKIFIALGENEIM